VHRDKQKYIRVRAWHYRDQNTDTFFIPQILLATDFECYSRFGHERFKVTGSFLTGLRYIKSPPLKFCFPSFYTRNGEILTRILKEDEQY